MGMRGHPRGDSAFVGVTPTPAGVAYQPAAILNSLHIVRQRSIILYIWGLAGQTRVSYIAVLGDIKRTAVGAFDLISG